VNGREEEEEEKIK